MRREKQTNAPIDLVLRLSLFLSSSPQQRLNRMPHRCASSIAIRSLASNRGGAVDV